MHRAENGRFISFFGDLHPSFFGNVVKAMGGAKRGYPVVSKALAAQPATAIPGADLIATARDTLSATVHAVNRLTPTIIEVVIRAPAAARAFRPGQFYRLQNFEVLAAHDDEPGIGRTLLNMEGLAMTGAWTDPKPGLVSVIALEMGGSSDLCAMLKPGEPVILMGPTGTPTEIHPDTTVALVGGGLGNAVLFSIGAATRAAGSKVIYFAGYKAIRDRYKVPDIERAADVMVWCCDEAPGFTPNPDRPQDKHLRRQYRPGDGSLCQRRPRSPGRAAEPGGAHDRHRLRPHDAGRRRRPPRHPGAPPEARTTPRSGQSTPPCSA